MTRLRTAITALLLWIGAYACGLPAADQVAVPPPGHRVTDLTHTLGAPTVDELEATLAAFEARKGSQVAVLLVPSTAPETIEQFSLRVAEQWKPGRRNVDDGAILVIARDDHSLRIEVGYGLEGALNDATAKRIISETIVPRFKAGQFDAGVTAGVAQMLKVIDGEALPPPPARPRHTASASADLDWLPLLVMVGAVVGMVLRAVIGRLPAAVVTGGMLGALAWWLLGTMFLTVISGFLGFVFTLMGGAMGSSGTWSSGPGGGFGGGGFGGGGGGGGGFSGGGGSFGGGGASGQW